MAKLDESTLVQMGREYPQFGAGYIVESMKQIGSRARRHQTLCEIACNEDRDGIDARIITCERRLALEVHESFPGTVVKTQRDPRGATVKLVPPSGATNDWGHEGLCVLA